ncbi:hypothetical protein DESC_810086 [Desulfosarcina cetonica]|nr:hypothetical protein DESC_810086 [Desulfosarcina cetonica]
MALTELARICDVNSATVSPVARGDSRKTPRRMSAECPFGYGAFRFSPYSALWAAYARGLCARRYPWRPVCQPSICRPFCLTANRAASFNLLQGEPP